MRIDAARLDLEHVIKLLPIHGHDEGPEHMKSLQLLTYDDDLGKSLNCPHFCISNQGLVQ